MSSKTRRLSIVTVLSAILLVSSGTPSISFAATTVVTLEPLSDGGYVLDFPIPKGAIVSLYAKGGDGGAASKPYVGAGGGGGACAYSSTAGYILCVGGGGGSYFGQTRGAGGAGGSTAGNGVGGGGTGYVSNVDGVAGTKNGAGGNGGTMVNTSILGGVGGAPGDGGLMGLAWGLNVPIAPYGGGGGGALFKPGGINHRNVNQFGSSKNLFTGTYLGGGNGCSTGGGGGGGYGGGGGGAAYGGDSYAFGSSGGGGSSFFHDKLSLPDANGYVSMLASVTESTISLYTGLGGINSCGGTTAGVAGNGTITLKYSCDSKYNTSCQSTATNSCGDTTSGTVNCDGSCSASAPAEREPVSCLLPLVYNVCGQYSTSYGLRSCPDSPCVGTASAAPPTAPPTASASVVGTTYAYDSKGVMFSVLGTRACFSITITEYAAFWGDTWQFEYNTTGIFNHYKNAPPGTERYALYVKDSTGKWSVPSQWSTVTLTTIPCDPRNICGQTNTVAGVLQDHTNGSGGTCSVLAPSNTTCAPSAPTIQGLFDQNDVLLLGGSAPAYNSSGYKIYAKATSLAGYKLTYYFEWGIMSADGTINWSADPPKWATLP